MRNLATVNVNVNANQNIYYDFEDDNVSIVVSLFLWQLAGCSIEMLFNSNEVTRCNSSKA